MILLYFFSSVSWDLFFIEFRIRFTFFFALSYVQCTSYSNCLSQTHIHTQTHTHSIQHALSTSQCFRHLWLELAYPTRFSIYFTIFSLSTLFLFRSCVYTQKEEIKTSITPSLSCSFSYFFFSPYLCHQFYERAFLSITNNK